MITFSNRTIVASTTVILGTVFMVGAMSADILAQDDNGTDIVPAKTSQAVEPLEKDAKKGDLKVDLSDVHSRPVRCVSKFRVTTCTGWPLSHDMIAFNEK